jgi:hypothetical protein
MASQLTEKPKGPGFWLEDPKALFSSFAFLPVDGMTRNEKLNALTRLALGITAGLYWTRYKHWMTFLLASVGAVVVLKFSTRGLTEGFAVPRTLRVPDSSEETTLAPVFAEEWVSPPPEYDLTSDDEVFYEEPPRLRSYPYGQMMSVTNTLPRDEEHIRLAGGLADARNYSNNAFLRHRMQNQEELIRLQKKRINRRFRHTTNNAVSGFASY